MDKKDSEKDVVNNENEVKDKKELKYKIELNEPPTVNEARATYTVDQIYTYEDYLNWTEDKRIELIDGKIYYLAAPTKTHQKLLGRLSNRFGIYLHGKSCDYYFAPFDVRIDLDIGEDSVIQPDLVVVCDDEKLNEKGLNGAPDLVIEILSKSTARRDRIIKYNKYLEVGVKEYWIIDPDREEIVVNLLRSGRYIAKTYVKGDVVKVNILDDLYINVTDLFEESIGDEVIEVEMARKEERIIAEDREQQAREEERIIANKRIDEERVRAEEEKLEAAENLITSCVAIDIVANSIKLSKEEIIKLYRR